MLMCAGYAELVGRQGGLLVWGGGGWDHLSTSWGGCDGNELGRVTTSSVPADAVTRFILTIYKSDTRLSRTEFRQRNCPPVLFDSIKGGLQSAGRGGEEASGGFSVLASGQLTLRSFPLCAASSTFTRRPNRSPRESGGSRTQESVNRGSIGTNKNEFLRRTVVHRPSPVLFT